jgi:hypothetical protein
MQTQNKNRRPNGGGSGGFSPLEEFDRLHNTQTLRTQQGSSQPGADGQRREPRSGHRALRAFPSLGRRGPIPATASYSKSRSAAKASGHGAVYWICWACLSLFGGIALGFIARSWRW